MLILEKPYVSETLINTAVKNNLPVLRNSMSELLVSRGYKLNLYDDKEFVEEYHKRHRLYSMSENGLGWIVEHIKDQELIDKIELLKDKATFRRICRDMYPDFFFEEVKMNELVNMSTDNLKFPLVLKPSVGFLSVGVYVVHNEIEWKAAIDDLEKNFVKSSAQFPEFVVGTAKFLIEEYIHGEEYAVDAYFDAEGNPAILNIYHHRFVSESDTSDRLYCSSKALYDKYEKPFTDFLVNINKVIGLRNFPMHIEFRYNGSMAIPIEINPLRFAGFCLNELQTHITGIHPVIAYLENIHISKEEMWNGREDDTFSFIVLERPAAAPESLAFDSEKFKSSFSDVLELREVKEASVGVAATAFTKTAKEHEAELDIILNMNMMEYMK